MVSSREDICIRLARPVRSGGTSTALVAWNFALESDHLTLHIRLLSLPVLDSNLLVATCTTMIVLVPNLHSLVESTL
jgi:hypothetical protein